MVIQYADIAPTTIWSNLATFAWNADGSTGAADGTPNTAHPISVSGLNRSEAQLAAGVQLLADFQTFVAGGALTGTASRNATIDQLVGQGVIHGRQHLPKLWDCGSVDHDHAELSGIG
jgi:hypothetical protein